MISGGLQKRKKRWTGMCATVEARSGRSVDMKLSLFIQENIKWQCENTHAQRWWVHTVSQWHSALQRQYPIKNGFTLMSVGVDFWIGGTGQVRIIMLTYTQTHSQIMRYTYNGYSLIYHTIHSHLQSILQPQSDGKTDGIKNVTQTELSMSMNK